MLYVNKCLKYEDVLTSYITKEEIRDVMDSLDSIKEKSADEEKIKITDFLIYLYNNDDISVEFFINQTSEEIEIFLNKVENELITTLQDDSDTELKKRIINSKMAENIEATDSKQIRTLSTSAYLF